MKLKNMYVLLKGFGTKFAAPLICVNIETPLYTGSCHVALVEEIPVKGVNVILGNDICGGVVFSSTPVVTVEPLVNQIDNTEFEGTEIFTVCAVTRNQSRKLVAENQNGLGLEALFTEKKLDSLEAMKLSKEEFIKAQTDDEELVMLRSLALQNPIDIVKEKTCYFVKDNMLLRKFGKDKRYEQIVVPNVYRNMLLELAHANEMSGHLGINKTYENCLGTIFGLR